MACHFNAINGLIIYQRKFGGHTIGKGKKPAKRAAKRGDWPSLYNTIPAIIKHDVNFFNEYFALDLIAHDNKTCKGVIARDLLSGTINIFNAKTVVLATVAMALCIMHICPYMYW